MLSRTLAVLPVARRALTASMPAASVVPSRLAHHGPPADYKWPTMDDLPAPCGCWQEHYDNNQRKYNIHLLLGVGFFIITVAVGKATGALDLYMTFPKRPASKY